MVWSQDVHHDVFLSPEYLMAFLDEIENGGSSSWGFPFSMKFLCGLDSKTKRFRRQ